MSCNSFLVKSHDSGNYYVKHRQDISNSMYYIYTYVHCMYEQTEYFLQFSKINGNATFAGNLIA